MDLSVNSHTDNVSGHINSYNGLLYTYAVYNAKIPTKDLKATINWKNAEGKIPKSLTLKLMIGEEIISKNTITEENAIDSDTWEYNFGEYPTLDMNGDPTQYTLSYEETNEGDLKFFDITVDGFTINNTYIAPEVKSQVKMKSYVDREKNNVKYKIDYLASIKKYSGDADIKITTTLPFEIDETNSKLDDGEYDAQKRSITWTAKIKDIDNIYDYSITKNVDLYATAVLPYAIEAKTVGEIQLTDAADYIDLVDTIDSIEVGTGNPKTGDTNLQKYLSIGLVGIAAILIVFSIKRKYSTKKTKVQF